MNPDMAAALDPQQTDSEQPNNPLNIPTLFCLANLGHKISHRESLYFARSRLAMPEPPSIPNLPMPTAP